jgi:type I restriction enzyme S subunit
MRDSNADWRRAKLRDLVSINPESLSSDTPPYYRFTYIDLTSVQERRIKWPSDTIRFGSAPSRARRVVRRGDILMSTVRPYLKGHARITKPVVDTVASTGFAVLRPNPNVSGEYIYQWLISPPAEKQFERVLVGSNYPALNINDVENLTVCVPIEEREQRKIAEILRTWDDAIDMESLYRNKHEQLYHGLVNALFERSYRQNLVPIKALVEPVTEYNHTALPLLAVTQDSGVVRRDELERRVVMPEGDTSNYKVVRAGDFVVSLRSFEGGLEFSRITGLVSPAYTVLRVVSDIDSDYYRHFFKSHSFIGRLQRLIFGIRDGKQIAFRDLGDMKIPNPSLERQKLIADSLNCVENAINICDMKIEAIRKQKCGLVQRLLTGGWRVNTEEAALEKVLLKHSEGVAISRRGGH